MQAALAVWVLIAGGTAAETVLLKNGIAVTGELMRYDERGVLIRLPSQQVREFLADEIRSIDAQFHPAHVAADEAFARRDVSAALALYQQALQAESRPWAQARLRIGLVRSLTGLSQLEPAAAEFFKLVENRSDIEVMSLAPLVWSPDAKADTAAQGAARRWLADPEKPIAQLVAASWLIDTAEEARAVGVLERLQTDRQQRVGWLARAQLFRVRLREATANDIDRYQGLVEKIPPGLRAGPQYVLGLAYEQAGKPTEAALAYLWVPFVYDGRSGLAEESLFRAAAAAGRAGFADDAQRLYRTLVQEYPASRFAAEAARRSRKGAAATPEAPGGKVSKERSL